MSIRQTCLVAVWDLPLRLFHWGLVLAVATALATGFFAPAPWLALHLAAGGAVAALLLFRLVWGFTGSGFSRFASFIYGPRRIAGHLRELIAGRHRAYAGHNPAGAAMIFALLAVLAALCVTGLIAWGGALKQGPLAFATSFSLGHDAREIHEALAWGLLALVCGHLAGVALESLLSRDNLARAMVTGRKRLAEIPAILPPRPRQALLWLAAIAVLLVPAGLWAARLPSKGMPPVPANAVMARECGACHTAYHPSLLPAASWRAVMADLSDHFGEDAGLDAATTASLTAWLTAHAAESWDSKAANNFRQVAVQEPRRITATAYWQHRHHDLAPALFAAQAIGGKANCGACHQDAATGRFDAQQIRIPKE